jgi:hypothetical protein
MPGGDALYRLFQHHVTRSIVPTPQRIQQKVDVGLHYLEHLRTIGREDSLTQGTHIDIGAGWHLTIPLLYWQLGCNTQVVVDIAELVQPEILYQVMRLLPACKVDGRVRRPLPEPHGIEFHSYLANLGISYHATLRKRVPVESRSAALVTSTQTLLHPTRCEVSRICSEVARVLEKGGFFDIHLYDLYSDLDPHLSRFNYPRYSDRTWQTFFNCRQMSYNRMRASEFEKIFDGLPFRKEIWDITTPTDEDLRALETLPLNVQFAGFDKRDLASSHLTFVLRRV